MCTEPLRNSINYLQTISTTPRDASSSVAVSTFPSSPGTSKCLTLSLLKNVMFFSKLLLDISVVCVYGNYRTATKMRINRIDFLISVLVKKGGRRRSNQPFFKKFCEGLLIISKAYNIFPITLRKISHVLRKIKGGGA